MQPTSGAAQPLLIVCVHGFGPQVVQDMISFGTAVESRFLSPCELNTTSLEESSAYVATSEAS